LKFAYIQGHRELAQCPALFWQVDEKIYRCQFYYCGYQQYGTGKNEFDDIVDCVVTMLQVHADREVIEQQS